MALPAATRSDNMGNITLLLQIVFSLAIISPSISPARAEVASDTLLHKWSFADATTRDTAGSAHGELYGGARIDKGRLHIMDNDQHMLVSKGLKPIPADKTLVVWVTNYRLDLSNSGILSIENGRGSPDEVFDAIVYNESIPNTRTGQWRAGSERWTRTNTSPANLGDERTAGQAGREVMIAVTYDSKAGTIHVYRNGKPYDSYPAKPHTFAKSATVYLGTFAEVIAPGYSSFYGSINEARIYGAALKQSQVSELYKIGPDADDLDAATPDPVETEVQAMFFRPKTTGRGWDTWWFYHDGTYYQYILSGQHARWTGVTLITSEDGVHWRNRGRVLARTPEAVYMGSGCVWKSPNFDRDGRFIMNFSEQYPPRAGKFPHEQVIYFAESKDLIHWKPLPDECAFRADERWYRRLGARWDCIYAIARGDGGYYGYWTGFPKSGSGRAFGQSDDGVHWEALKPVECPGIAEVAGVERIAGKYYMISQARRVFVADRPQGPFRPAVKNHDLLSVVTPFPRFFRKGEEVFVTNHAVAVHHPSKPTYCLPLKVAHVDEEGTLRATYWKGNDALKERAVLLKFVDADGDSPRMIEHEIAVQTGCILEATYQSPTKDANTKPCLFIDCENGDHVAVQVHTDGTVAMGLLAKDGRTLKVHHRANRLISLDKSVRLRLMLKDSLFEFYLNDVLMDCFRMPSMSNGKLGVSADLEDVKVWEARSGDPVGTK
ncbi:MAG: hypothetical protein HQ567_14855 [Candidatus Nealsonbacteria bacterium]|nr:hypothetical protein [Candidatus Nealsonbacteria bacterium]